MTATDKPVEPQQGAMSSPVPKVPVRLGDRDVMALVDSGASLSVVSMSFVRGIGLSLRDVDLHAEMANGDTVKALGSVDLDLEVVGRKARLPFIVFEDIATRHYEAIWAATLSRCSACSSTWRRVD